MAHKLAACAVDPRAAAFNSGMAEGLREAVKLVEKALQAEQTERLKRAAQGGEPGGLWGAAGGSNPG